MDSVDQLTDMLHGVVDQLRAMLTHEEVLGLASVMALQELLVETKDAIAHREQVDPLSLRAHSGRAALVLMGVTDALVEGLRMRFSQPGPMVGQQSHWRN